MTSFLCRRCGHDPFWHDHFSKATHCGECAECNAYVGPTLADRVRVFWRSLWV